MTRFVGISDETQINSKDVITIKLPATGTFYQGDQLVAEKLVTGSRTNYVGEEVEAGTVNAETVIIINQNVYKDEFGNRHGLVANVGKITYTAGETVTALRASKNVILEMTADCIDLNGTASIADTVGKYLIPKVKGVDTKGKDDRKLVVVDTIGTAGTAYKIEAVSSIAKPGVRAQSVIVRTMK